MDATHAVTNMVTLAEVNENKVTPGLLGFVVFAVLAVGVWLLMKSMHHHMGRVDFAEQQPAGDKTPAGQASASAAAPASGKSTKTTKSTKGTAQAKK
jgi:hypothetical protein